jgi:hypothetical protein
MSEDKKDPFSEKTVVQTKEEATPTPVRGGEKTVVFAQSNLKETFDAKTVVRSSKPASLPDSLPTEAPPPAPHETPAKVIAVELPEVSIGEADTNPDVRVSSAAFVSASEADSEKPKLSKAERRAARAELDRKTRTYVAAFAAVCVLAIACVVVAFGNKTPEKSAVANAAGETPNLETTEMASEADSAPPVHMAKEAPSLGAYKTTTEVLKDFERAAKKAQDRSVGF